MNTDRVYLKSESACIISITDKGNATAKKIYSRLKTRGGKIDLFTLKNKMTKLREREGFRAVEDLDSFFKSAFKNYDTIIAIMSTGIVVRKIAPLLVSKSTDPGIIVADVLGENYISLISGHLGHANENTRILEKVMKGRAIITTASDKLKFPAVDTIAESIGAKISSLEKAKDITALILENKKVALIGFNEIDFKDYPELSGLAFNHLIKLPYPPDLFDRDKQYSNLDNIMPELKKQFSGVIILSSRERLTPFPIPAVHLIPKSTVIGIGFKKEISAKEIVEQTKKLLDEINISPVSVSAFATIALKAEAKALQEAAESFNAKVITVPDEEVKSIQNRFLGSDFVENTVGVTSVSEPCGYIASGGGECILEGIRDKGMVISVWREAEKKKQSIKKVYVTGIGPGSKEMISRKALDSLIKADVIAGYKTYIDLIKDYSELEKKEFLATGMKAEKDRAQMVLDLADKGNTVALISSGDPGVYGMASILLELAENREGTYDIEVIPGITSANASAAALGAPLSHDYCTISLSDLLTPWETIEKRLSAAAEADFVIALYNPKSASRTDQIQRAREILLKYRDPKTPVGIVTRATRDGEEIVITNLEMMGESEINMFSTVIIGNSNTYISKDGSRMITPRGYEL